MEDFQVSQNILNSLPSVVLLTGACGALQGGRSGSGLPGSAWCGQSASRAALWLPPSRRQRGCRGWDGAGTTAGLSAEGSGSSAFRDKTSGRALGGVCWRRAGLVGCEEHKLCSDLASHHPCCRSTGTVVFSGMGLGSLPGLSAGSARSLRHEIGLSPGLAGSAHGGGTVQCYPQCWEPQGPAAAVMGTRRRKLLDLFPSQAFQNTGANISYIPG